MRSLQQINNSLYWRENIEKFLSADIICSWMQNCELRGTDHIQGRIYEHIFAQIIGYRAFKYFATHVEKILRTAQLFFCLECFLDCSPYFCNNHKKALSHLELNFHSRPKVWKLGNMTCVIFTDISCSKRQQLLSKSCRAKSGKIKSSHSMFKIYSFSFVSRNSLDYLTGEHLRTNIIMPFICTLFCRRR